MSKRPLPTQMKILRGTARPCRLNRSEPKPPIEAPARPKHLSKGATKEWKRIAPQLEEMGLLSNMDMAALAGYCELYARWVKAEDEIQQHGEVITTPNGSLQVSPWVSIAHRSMVEMRKFAAEFGLSPASRSKVSASPNMKENNPFAEFNRKSTES